MRSSPGSTPAGSTSSSPTWGCELGPPLAWGRDPLSGGRVVRVLPDVPAIDKTFDYSVPDRWADAICVGAMVRVPLHGRRVGGWVVGVDVEPPPGVTLQPLAKVSGSGPPPEVIELARWAAWRWAGRTAQLLGTASPPRMVTVPTAPAPPEPAPGRSEVVRVPPGRSAVEHVPPGNALVLVPEHSRALTWARHLGAALYPGEWARGARGASVVGTRAAAFAPVGRLAAILVVDEHDEAFQEERAPTWHARDVAIERARRAGVPCVLTSPTPSLEALDALPLRTPPRGVEYEGWPLVEVVDRRGEDPVRAGLYSDHLVRWLRSDRRVVCVLNRRGRAQLLACDACGALAVCDECGASVHQPQPGTLRCRAAGHERPVVCTACGSNRFKNLRAGVSRVREELEALVHEPVEEVTADTAADAEHAARLAGARVVVGTEAVLHRVRRSDVVAFLELDQELTAPRFRAAEQALALLARAARVVGPRARGGRLLLQTRQPGHAAIRAAVHADPARLADVELDKRRALGLPPMSALAVISGPAAEAFTERIGHPLGVEIRPQADGRWLLRATDHERLADALSGVERPPGRLRVEVDPLRV